MILVDTNVVSETSRKRPDERVEAWLRSNAGRLRLPIVTLAELFYGVEKLPDGSQERSDLQMWVAQVERRFAGCILPFDRRAAQAHGALRAKLKRRGLPMGAQDSYIAAIALARNLPLATRNTKHFVHAGLQLVDPWTA